jgi:hypothetical protein
MSSPRIAILVSFLCAVSAPLCAQSGSTDRHPGAHTSAPVTITVDDVVAAPKPADKAPSKHSAKNTKKKTEEVDLEKAAEQAKKERIHTLLDRAYALTEQLTPLERWSVMTSLLDVAGREYPEKAVDWAIDLWTVAKDLPDRQRMSAQSTVISTVARIDPDKALALLPMMDKSNELDGVAWPSFAATAVFGEMQRKHGASVIPELQKVARSMAKDGSYPYLAAASLMGHGWRRDNESESSSEQSASIFRDAFQAYQTAPEHSNDQGFTQFLMQTWRNAPRELAVQAADSLAQNLLGVGADSNFNGSLQVDGKKIGLHSRADAQLVQLMRVLKELDPGMLAKVIEARPDFAGAQDGRMNGMRTSFNSGQPASPEMQQQVAQIRQRSDTMRMARTDPDKALATAATMSDAGDKANMLAMTASAMARNSPEDAAKVLDEAQKIAAQVQDQMAELRIVVSSAQAAKQLKQPQRVREFMARGLELGSQLVRKQMDDHPETNGQGEALGYMNSLVSMGMADDPNGVTAVIDAVPYPMAKAMLYTTAARSMQWGGRFRGDMGMASGFINGGGGAVVSVGPLPR